MNEYRLISRQGCRERLIVENADHENHDCAKCSALTSWCSGFPLSLDQPGVIRVNVVIIIIIRYDLCGASAQRYRNT